MTAYEFISKIEKNNSIKLPEEIAVKFKKDERVRVILLTDDSHGKKIKSSLNELSMQDYGYNMIDQSAVYDDF